MPPLKFDLDLTVGAIEIALNFSALLVGCATVQAYTYYRSFPNDRLFLKVLVATVWSLELGSHITSSQTVYKFSITEWGKPLGLLQPSKSLVATVYLSAIIAPTVETFYLYRIYKFAGKKSLYIVGLAAVVVWLRYAGWVLLSIQIDRLGIVDGRFLDRWSWLVIVQLSVGASMDAAISATIVYFLWRKRLGNIGASRSTVLIHRIVRWTIQTGLIASAAFLVALSTFLAMPDTLVWLGILAVLSKIFSNCFFASLNARKTIQEVHSSAAGNIPLSSWGDIWQTASPITEIRSTMSNPGRQALRFADDSVIDIHVSKEILQVAA